MTITRLKPRHPYVRRARYTSMVAWIVLVLAVTLCAVWTFQQVGSLDSAQEVAALTERTHESDLADLHQSREAAAEAQDALDRAITREAATLLSLSSAQSRAAFAFDSAVEALALQGKIARNPYSGLGIPPQYLIEEMGNATATSAGAHERATENLQSRQRDNEQGQDTHQSLVEDAKSAGELQLVAEAIVASTQGELNRRLAISGGIVVALLAIAAAFSISSAKAHALLENTHNATSDDEEL
ncbi:hypothetical protein [Salinibacterium sp. SWN248]|uniref:hypothetical protein n=1 Tax=Salinibacterium sp. SWN248 TaxID=2792056 RepID=UPI0018CD9332|nr:hypothetical protein [Salinibacterium sp. SWN248]MBH0023978.1 hypothetical protein [Salinibacterium sp. SWN248]